MAQKDTNISLLSCLTHDDPGADGPGIDGGIDGTGAGIGLVCLCFRDLWGGITCIATRGDEGAGRDLSRIG